MGQFNSTGFFSSCNCGNYSNMGQFNSTGFFSSCNCGNYSNMGQFNSTGFFSSCNCGNYSNMGQFNSTGFFSSCNCGNYSNMGQFNSTGFFSRCKSNWWWLQQYKSVQFITILCCVSLTYLFNGRMIWKFVICINYFRHLKKKSLLLLLPVKRPQSSSWLFCHFMEGQQRKLKKKKKEKKERKKKKKKKKGGGGGGGITAVWRPLAQMCRWSWPQWLPGAGHSSLWWFSAGMRTAGTGFCSVAARTAGCVFVVDEGVVVGACS